MKPTTEAGRTRDEAIDAALLYVFQLSGRDYDKMRTALSSVAFVRALEQDGWTVAPQEAVAEYRKALAARVKALPRLYQPVPTGMDGPRIDRNAVLALIEENAEGSGS